MVDGIIETITSPWRAQVVVKTTGKQRLCVDYSQTINLYTELDAYLLPRIDDMVNKLAQYKYFSTFNLKSAYHQVSINPAERKYTGFEANGVAVFQRQMDTLITKEKLSDTFPYLDDITVAGRTQTEHDQNVRAFFRGCEKQAPYLKQLKISSIIFK